MTFEKFEIHVAGKEEAYLISDMSRQTFYDSFAAQNSKENMESFLNGQFSHALLMGEVGKAGNIFLLAYLGKGAVGYAKMTESASPAGLGDLPAIEISRIYVIKNVIGKGVGKELMKHCLNLAREKGKKIIWLGVWEHNLQAISFYHKWGFERFSQHIFMLGADPQTDWLMRKSL
jgi:diamine N-acetyltransferase